jgi:predicted Zn-dependent protease with MMP-like domain
LWDFAKGDEAIYVEEVRTTFLHELGHFFGFDEEGLAERGLD